MWRWPQNWQLKKHKQFWLKLIGFSLFGHLIVLGLAFFSHKKTNLKLTVFAKPRKNVEVIFMPMYKKIDQKTKVKQPVAKKPDIKKSEIKQAVKKPKPEVKKTQKPKSQPQKKAPKKPEPVKKESKVQAKKPEPKAVVKTKPKAVIKDEPKPLVVPVQEPVVHEPIYLGRDDLKAFELMGELETVLVQNWQPPIGFGSQVECVVEIVVGPTGEIVDLLIKKSSNILAYDMSVRRNFNGMVLPKSASNKILTVVFRP